MGVTVAPVVPQQGDPDPGWTPQAERAVGDGLEGETDRVQDSGSMSTWKQALSTLRGWRHGQAALPRWVPQGPSWPREPGPATFSPHGSWQSPDLAQGRAPWPPGPAPAPHTAGRSVHTQGPPSLSPSPLPRKSSPVTSAPPSAPQPVPPRACCLLCFRQRALWPGWGPGPSRWTF